ncbi:hypothetical protein HDU76_012892 [Blyttiomyces sp. JEL0837]|nr:hypothetical protein HDU76_012892 [Blyttiomyces sp. JEL0837]
MLWTTAPANLESSDSANLFDKKLKICTCNDHNISVSCVHPGLIQTGMFNGVDMKFQWLTPPFKTIQVANSIMGVIKGNRSVDVKLPFFGELMPIMRMLPVEFADWIRDVTGANESMGTFKVNLSDWKSATVPDSTDETFVSHRHFTESPKCAWALLMVKSVGWDSEHLSSSSYTGNTDGEGGSDATETGGDGDEEEFVEKETGGKRGLKRNANTAAGGKGEKRSKKMVVGKVGNGEDDRYAPWSEVMISAREKTFEMGWPHHGVEGWNCTARKIAETGMFYKPNPDENDYAECSYCHLGLAGWEANDDPIFEHRKRSADCIIFKAPSRTEPKETVAPAAEKVATDTANEAVVPEVVAPPPVINTTEEKRDKTRKPWSKKEVQAHDAGVVVAEEANIDGGKSSVNLDIKPSEDVSSSTTLKVLPEAAPSSTPAPEPVSAEPALPVEKETKASGRATRAKRGQKARADEDAKAVETPISADAVATAAAADEIMAEPPTKRTRVTKAARAQTQTRTQPTRKKAAVVVVDESNVDEVAEEMPSATENVADEQRADMEVDREEVTEAIDVKDAEKEKNVDMAVEKDVNAQEVVTSAEVSNEPVKKLDEQMVNDVTSREETVVEEAEEKGDAMEVEPEVEVEAKKVEKGAKKVEKDAKDVKKGRPKAADKVKGKVDTKSNVKVKEPVTTKDEPSRGKVKEKVKDKKETTVQEKEKDVDGQVETVGTPMEEKEDQIEDDPDFQTLPVVAASKKRAAVGKKRVVGATGTQKPEKAVAVVKTDPAAKAADASEAPPTSVPAAEATLPTQPSSIKEATKPAPRRGGRVAKAQSAAVSKPRDVQPKIVSVETEPVTTVAETTTTPTTTTSQPATVTEREEVTGMTANPKDLLKEDREPKRDGAALRPVDAPKPDESKEPVTSISQIATGSPVVADGEKVVIAKLLAAVKAGEKARSDSGVNGNQGAKSEATKTVFVETSVAPISKETRSAAAEGKMVNPPAVAVAAERTHVVTQCQDDDDDGSEMDMETDSTPKASQTHAGYVSGTPDTAVPIRTSQDKPMPVAKAFVAGATREDVYAESAALSSQPLLDLDDLELMRMRIMSGDDNVSSARIAVSFENGLSAEEKAMTVEEFLKSDMRKQVERVRREGAAILNTLKDEAAVVKARINKL